MTLETALDYHLPVGPYAGLSLAVLSLDRPDYLIRLSEGAVPEECPPGSPIDAAVRVVADAILDAWAADILAGRTLGPDDFTRADELIDGTFGPAGTERARADHARRGRAYPERPRDEPEPMALFKTFK